MRFFFLIGIILLSSKVFSFNSQFTVRERQAWVQLIDIKSIDTSKKLDPNASTRYILVDKQVNIVSEESYYHYARKVLNEEGVQNEVKLAFTFDPEYQELYIHSVSILRDNQQINKLKENKVKVIQRETNLERKIYNGRLTAIILLEDIRVGDILNYEYSIKGINPAFQGKYSNFFRLSWSSPVDFVSYRLIVPALRNINYLNHNTDIEPSIGKKADYKVYRWSLYNTAEIIEDNNLPGWYDPYSYIQISEFQSWNEVAVLAAKLYKNHHTSTYELKTKVKEIRKSFESKDDQILMAMRYIQDEIKYLGLEFGINGYKPTDPNLVNKRRFGDCKDKTNLFCTILDELDVKSYPILVHSSFKDRIKEWLPTLHAFDHVITQFEYENKTYWVDPTVSLQGGNIKSLVSVDLKSGLIVSPNSEHLVNYPINGMDCSKITALETYTIDDYKTPISLKICTNYFGMEADKIRSYIQRNSHKSISKTYLEYIAGYYSNAEISDSLIISDDRSQNIITITEFYTIPDFWEMGQDSLQYNRTVYPTVFNNYFPEVKSPIRAMPFVLKYPKNVEDLIEIHFPDDWVIKSVEKKIKNEYLNFKYSKEYNKKTLSLKYSFNSNKDHVPVADFRQFYNDMEKIDDFIGDYLYRTIAKNEVFTPNWILMILTFLFISLLVYFFIKLYKHNLFIKIESLTPNTNLEISGIKGWLIVWLISIIIAVLMHVYSINDFLFLFNNNTWLKLTTASSESYHSLWAPTLIFEMFSIIFFVSIYIFSLIAFLKKKMFVPRLMILIMIIHFFVNLIDAILLDYIDVIEVHIKNTAAKNVFHSAIRAAIWIPYFTKSERVKNTFIEK